MRVRVLFAIGVTTSALAIGAPVPAVSAATNAPPPPHVIRLHAAFERALANVTAGAIGGLVPALGTHHAAGPARATVACAEPNCDLTFGGGYVQHSPHVYLLLWGPNWTTSSPVYSYLYNFYKGLGVSPKDTWSTITSQYGDASGQPGFGSSVFEGAFQDSSAPPADVSPNDLAAEADGFAGSQGLTDLADAQIIVASQSGTCFTDGFAGNCGSFDSSGVYCAWHSIAGGGVPFTNLPYLLDAGAACGENFINSGAAGTYDGLSMIGGHEYAETITDPDPPTGWTDPADSVSGGEIGDKCVWGGQSFDVTDPDGNVTLSTGRYAMQSLWSNADRRCVMTSAPRVTITSPGTQRATLGSRVSVAVHASTNTDTALSFAASGLPPGLSVSRTSGRITGTPATTAGTWHPRVTVSDYAGAAHAVFAWQIRSKAGQVTGYARRCADDHAGRRTSGNKIDLWSCDGQARQRIIFAANGELQVLGRCITATRAGAELKACSASADQTWTRRANGEYVVKSSRQCLTDPHRSKANGTQLIISRCAATPGQRWSLP